MIQWNLGLIGALLSGALAVITILLGVRDRHDPMAASVLTGGAAMFSLALYLIVLSITPSEEAPWPIIGAILLLNWLAFSYLSIRYWRRARREMLRKAPEDRGRPNELR